MHLSIVGETQPCYVAPMRTLLIYSAIVISSACVALVIGFGYLMAQAPEIVVASEVPGDPKQKYVYDNLTGWTNRPGAIWTDIGGGRTVHTEIGQRGERIISGQRDGGPLVMTVGGSQTYGHGVPAENTFGAVLANKLAGRTVNLGVSGYGGTQSYLMALRNLDMKPDVVVYGLWFSHPYRDRNHCLESPEPRCAERPTIIRMPWSGLRLALPQGYTWAEGDPLEPQWSVLAPALREASTLYSNQSLFSDAVLGALGRLGVPVVVVYIPDYIAGPMGPVPDEIRAAADKAGVTLVDMTEKFKSMRADGNLIRLVDDGHMNDEAHAAIAEAVYAAMNNQ